MASSKDIVVVGIGEILWDYFGDQRLPGGAPGNVAYHATRFGLTGRLCSRVGSDAAGDDLLALLRDRGVDDRLVERDPERPTGRVTVDTADPASPAFTIHENVAWDAIVPNPDLERACRGCDALCVGTLAQRSEISRGTIRQCLDWAANALTVYDVNLRPPYYRREWIEATLDLARVVKLNEDEAQLLDRLLDVGAGDPVGFARAVLDRYRVDLVCLTLGARGCALVDREGVHEEPAPRVEVVDAVGAGDAFTAALIHGLLRGHEAARVARAANRLGAAVAARAGGMPELGDLHHEIGADG